MLNERSQTHVNILMTRVTLIAVVLIVSQLPLSIEAQNAPRTMNRQSIQTTLSGSLFNSTSNATSRTSPSLLNVWSSHGPPLNYGERVNSVAVDPNNGRVVYAGMDDYKAFSYGKVYKSTDGGTSWTESDLGLLGAAVWRLAIDRSNPKIVYAVTYDGTATGSGLYKSTDGGEQWYLTTAPGPQVNTLAIAPSNPNIIYAGNETYSYPDIFSFLVSTDSGQTWDVLPLPVPPVYPSGALTVHPQNPSIIYASGYGAACKSSNGGVSWTCYGYGGAAGATHSFAIDFQDTNVIYAATDEGVYKSVNAGVSWVRLGIIVRAYSVAIDPRDHNSVYVGVTNDNGNGGVHKSTDGGGSWSPFNDGMGLPPVTDLAFDRAGVFLHANGVGAVFDVQVRDAADSNPISDFDGDGRSDISVFRPSDSVWYLNRSTDGFAATQFGISTDKLTPADHDGDGKTDIAVYRPETGIWYVFNSGNGTISYHVFGIAEDLPTPADYDGDGIADISVFRPSTGTWYRRNSSDGSSYAIQFGLSEDKPTIGDFDGDGHSDIAVFRPSVGAWYQLNSSNNQVTGEQFGFGTDVVTPADYDGDSKTDMAVFRPSNGFWYVKNSNGPVYTAFPFGLSEDIPAAGDFDGDGRADLSVFRPSDGTWYRTNSSNGSFFAYQFGTNGDKPTHAAFRY